MRRVVRGFWEPREESAEAPAGRWKPTPDQLAGLLPAAGSGAGSRGGAGEEWTWRNVPASGPATGLRPDEASLLAVLRTALLPDDMTAVRKEVRGGGVLLEIASRGDVEAVVQADLRLREAGALQPLPRPIDRTAL